MADRIFQAISGIQERCKGNFLIPKPQPHLTKRLPGYAPLCELSKA